MTVTFAEEPIADIIETEMWPLLVEHREELTTNKALMVLKPDVERYRAMEAQGACFTVMARDEGRIVGYAINLISPNIHYRDVLTVYNDALWTLPSHRCAIGAPLMDAARAASRARGAHVLLWHAKPDTILDRVMRIQVRRKRAKVQDVVYSETL